MKPIRLFISSVQKEFAPERAALRDYLRGDALMRRFFDAFFFEDIPAKDRRADSLYLDEVAACNVYVGLFGYEYGNEDARGISPTQREFDLATEKGKPRLIFVKGSDDRNRHPKMLALIRKVGSELIRRRFVSTSELVSNLYAALVEFLEERELIRTVPFDAAPCPGAALSDLDENKMQRFIREARHSRGFPLREGTPPDELLTHLNLLDKGRPVNAALLLFARQPQRFLLSSEVKCAHFHGVEVAKPIPSYQVYKGTVFEMVDQAVDFVMSKINLNVGTRSEGPQAPVTYEIPREVVGEAIVNAVAHRDYASNGSVQVMLFSDRLEVWNPGNLPSTLTLEKLRKPHGSVPANPLIAEPLYLTEYIERMGTGIRDMIRRCREAGLPEPDFSLSDGFTTTIYRSIVRIQYDKHGAVALTGEVAGEVAGEVTVEVAKLLVVCQGAMSRRELRETLQLKGDDNFRRLYLVPAQEAGFVEMTIPEKPNSRLQKYRLTKKGAEMQDLLRKGRGSQ